MSKEKQALGAPEGEHKITANNADELLAELQAESKKTSQNKKKKKIEDYKVVQATREMLINRKGQILNVPIIIDNEEAWNFKVRRISEAENSDILDRTLAVKNFNEMTPEELEASNDYNFRLLALSVVEPKMSEDEWKGVVDAPMARKLVQQISKVITDVNADGIFDDFQR
ncbi:MAG: hypothetical protein J6A15_00765 [Clostridia bacterium]|nr:hypothetical protein [Clostridia bacterium]